MTPSEDLRDEVAEPASVTETSEVPAEEAPPDQQADQHLDQHVHQHVDQHVDQHLDQHVDQRAADLYDAAYYTSGCGPVPYERSDHWLGFFAGISEQLARSLNPRKVLDAGCAMGFLVEALWDRGIEASGIDVSSYAISKVRRDVASYCRVASLAEPIADTYDLITCIEVLEHIPPDEAVLAVKNLCGATNTILFSSTPSDFDEPTHVNVRPTAYWLKLFGEFGFQPDILYDAGFLTPHAYLLRKGLPKLPEDTLILFSRLVLCRCVLAAGHNQINELSRQIVAFNKSTGELVQEREILTARYRELEGVRDHFQQQSDSLLSALRGAEAERDTARETARHQLREAAVQMERAQDELAKSRNSLNAAEEHARDQARRYSAESEKQFHDARRQSAEAEQQLHDALERTTELREQNAAFANQIVSLTRDNATLSSELRAVLESPGWKFIQRYRNWLETTINSHPRLKKSYEPIVWWFLRRFSGQRSRTAHTETAPQGESSGSTPSQAEPPVAVAAPWSEPKHPTFQQWISENEPDTAALAIQKERAQSLVNTPLISVVVPVYRISLPILKACIRSVLEQTYEHWELCLVHGAPDDTAQRTYLSELAAEDSRIKLVLLEDNLGISGNSNAALELATGGFVALLDHDDTLAPFALYEVASALCADPELDVIYSDHDYIDEAGARSNPLFKPDWSPEIMLSANYITHLTVLRRSCVVDAGGFDPRQDGAQDWDLFFRITERTSRIGHIPRILYHWRTHSSSTALNTSAKDYAEAAQIRSIQAHLDRVGLPAQAEVAADGLLHIRWSPSRERRVSIIIPSKDKVDLLSRCISSLRRITAYQNYEILVIDNGSADPATHAYYKILAGNPSVKVLPYPHPFNFSAMNNYGVKHASGDLLLFLNNDVEITRAEWLDELVGWTLVPEVGVTGAKLLLPEGVLQHAGVVVGLGGFADHPFASSAPLTFNMFGSTGWYRNYLAVTGACMMLRREVFDQIGGFDEKFISCGSDVELCLRAWEHGYRTVYNPFAELIHYECQTREGYVPREDYVASFRHYLSYLLNGDPYWNPNLSVWDKTIGLRNRDEESSFTFAQNFIKARQSDYPNGQPEKMTLPSAAGDSKEEDLVVAWFDHTSADVRLSKDLMASVEGFRPVRKIVWFIPTFENAFYGGIFTILRFADVWSRTEGVVNHFAVCGSVSRDEMVERIQKVHPACTAGSVTILATPSDAGDLPAADISIATLWTTAYYVLKFQKAPRKFYFIQDYEPGFYRAGSASALVENTYRMGFYGIANTISLKNIYESEYGGTAEHFTPSVNSSIFYPLAASHSTSPQTFQLFCYARPQHPRNAFELLAAALRIVKSKLGARVRIVCAGSQWEPADYGLDGVVENLGLLGYEETAELYRTCHAGVVFMLTRHPSYIPMELMASGCLVITNRNHWTKWLLKDRENCLLSDTTAQCLAETIETGLTDNALRGRITRAARETVQGLGGWEPEIAKIYRFLCDPEHAREPDWAASEHLAGRESAPVASASA